MLRFTLLTVFWLIYAVSAGADIPLNGECAVGASQSAHGLSAEEAETRIKQYARLYTENYTAYKRQERDARRGAYSYMELKSWTQDDVIGFTLQQRELLYISIGGELAVAKVDVSELEGFVAAIDRKLIDLEIELGCEMLPQGQ